VEKTNIRTPKETQVNFHRGTPINTKALNLSAQFNLGEGQAQATLHLLSSAVNN
jgi:hypothetical protein